MWLALVSTHEGLEETPYQNILSGAQIDVNKFLPKHHCLPGLLLV